MCNAYAEIGLLVLMYGVCSLHLVICLIVLQRTVASVTLECVHSAGICADLNYFISELFMYSVCVAHRAIFKVVCLKKLVIFHISGL
jgi:hypothetical protein